MIKCYVYLLMLLDLSLALHFQDWSRKFVKPLLLNFGGTQTEENLPKFYSNQFYDPQWAFHIMDRKRDYKPNIDSKSFKRKIFHSNFTIWVKLQNQKTHQNSWKYDGFWLFWFDEKNGRNSKTSKFVKINGFWLFWFDEKNCKNSKTSKCGVLFWFKK